MIRTYGLTHLALAVKDTERSFRFYEQVFGVKAIYREPGQVQVQTPGCRDVLVFEEGAKASRRKGGLAHFGFRLTDPKEIDAAARVVERAGGRILDKGEFVPGEPYIFFRDPDGYTVEIWYE
jgi:catechol 2,3-dioxygenase-like lactoylglutathione lyase family enzyme